MSNRRYDIREHTTSKNNSAAALPDTRDSIRKLTDYFPDATKTPVRLLNVTSARYDSDWHSIQHTHYFTELFFITGGSGSFLVEEESFPVEPNMLVIVNPHILHTELSSPKTPLEYVVLGVEGLLFSEIDADGGFHNSSCSRAVLRQDLTAIHTCLNQLVREMQQQQPYLDIVCQHWLQLLLIYVLRQKRLQLSLCETKQASSEISSVKNYIDTHFKQSVALEELAELSHLNKYYLVHHFTKTYGISPINYLLARRLEESKGLLATTDYSIAQIAQITGFSSPGYFSQRFRHSFGMSPKEYREQFER